MHVRYDYPIPRAAAGGDGCPRRWWLAASVAGIGSLRNRTRLCPAGEAIIVGYHRRCGVVWHGGVIRSMSHFHAGLICNCCLACLPYATVQQGARHGRLPFPMSAMAAREYGCRMMCKVAS